MDKRLKTLYRVFFALFLLLLIRIFTLQVVKGDELFSAASAQHLKSYELESLRGDILDRNNISFTNRKEKSLIIINPLYFNGNDEVLIKICQMLTKDYDAVRRKLQLKGEPVIIETSGDKKNEILALKENGISAIDTPQRYDENTLATHVLGYVNSSGMGEAGIEKFYNDILVYDSGLILSAVTDANRKILKGLGYKMVKNEGENEKLNVKLTLDYSIQQIVEKIMGDNGINGAVVVEDVYTGDILALASIMDFDQNNIAMYLDSPQKELFNRAVASYNLGSIFKIIDVAAAFEADVDTDSFYFCTGYSDIGGGQIFKCSSYKRGGHGLVDLNQAFAMSCNTFFINLGLDIGYRNLISMARKFGLGNITGIENQGVDESPGHLPEIDAYYSKGDIANISIGQGEIMATPLQVADMIATVANGGIKNAVNIVDSIVDAEGSKVRQIRSDAGSRIISKKTADRIKQMMELVVSEGTGKNIELSGYGGAAGKTGSAETGRKRDGEDIVHAWFGGYFPLRSPRYAVAVFIENGKYGGSAAGPVFEEIAIQIMKMHL